MVQWTRQRAFSEIMRLREGREREREREGFFLGAELKRCLETQ